MQKLYRKLKENGRVKEHPQFGYALSDTTINRLHAIFHQAMEDALHAHIIAKNPTVGATVPKVSHAPKRVLTVNKQAYTINGELQIIPPKTRASVRKLVLPPAVLAVLREYRKKVDSRWMFPSPVKENSPITPGVVRRRLQLILEHAGSKHVRFHDLRHTFTTLALENGMDVKTLSVVLGHVSAATTLDIYTHITDDMRLTAAANIDRGIGKVAPQKETLELGQEPAPATTEKPRMTDFKPYVGRKRRSGTGCVTEINDHLFEGRYSPKWSDGKKHARNVYAHTREECEEKLKVLIVEMKAEIAEAQRLKDLGEGDGRPPEREKSKMAVRERSKIIG